MVNNLGTPAAKASTPIKSTTLLSPLMNTPDTTIDTLTRRPTNSPRNRVHNSTGFNCDEHSPSSSSTTQRGSMNAVGGFFFNRSNSNHPVRESYGQQRGEGGGLSSRSNRNGGRGGGSGSNRSSARLTAYGGNSSSPPYFPAPAGILPELAVPQNSRGGHAQLGSRAHRGRGHHGGSNRHAGGGLGGGFAGGGGPKGGSLVPSPPPASLNLIVSIAGDSLLFSETNMDWTKLNIFRTRLCDRLTQTHNCHMANRCLFSHDVNWPRRTPFLPRATALTLRYIPVWCPRLSWPPLVGFCDSSGKISWTSADDSWNARYCHQKCTRGDNCPFVHNVEEFLYHPEVYKTRSCCLANDDDFEEQMNTQCAALCPWYFCPFAHDVYELRNLQEARYAWHPPPQIVDDDHVARTQDFDELEKKIIEFVRRAPNGSLDLYTSPDSPLARHWRERMPPVLKPIAGSSLEQLAASPSHRKSNFDDLMHLMIVASFLNLLLYPVENFYLPTLLSLQCAVLQCQMGYGGCDLDCATLLHRFHCFIEDNCSAAAQEFEDATTSASPLGDINNTQENSAKFSSPTSLSSLRHVDTSPSSHHLLHQPHSWHDSPHDLEAQSFTPSHHYTARATLNTPYSQLSKEDSSSTAYTSSRELFEMGGHGSSSAVGGSEGLVVRRGASVGSLTVGNSLGATGKASGEDLEGSHGSDLQAILELLKPEELLQMMAFLGGSTSAGGTSPASPPAPPSTDDAQTS